MSSRRIVVRVLSRARRLLSLLSSRLWEIKEQLQEAAMHRRWMRGYIRELPATPSSLVTEGAVRAVGTVRAQGERLTAPVSGRPCVAYEVRVSLTQYRKFDEDEVLNRKEARPFLIEDEHGAVLVDPGEHFQLALVSEPRDGGPVWYRPGSQAEADRIRAFMFLVDHSFELSSLRYYEGILEEGERVAVRGHAAREVDRQAQRRHPRDLPLATVIRGAPGAAVFISDDPSTVE